MNLSKDFTLVEFVRSETAVDRGLLEQFEPPPDVIYNLTLLCRYILQPLRDAIGIPIHISSGWRCPALNKIVGGVPTSQHPMGEAADLENFGKGGNKAIFDKIIELDLPFDQLINENNFAWVHVSYKTNGRRQVLST